MYMLKWKILKYQLKHGGLSSYMAISKSVLCILSSGFYVVDQGSKDHYPGYHGKNYPLNIKRLDEARFKFLEAFLGNDAFASYDVLKDIQISLSDGAHVNAGELALLLLKKQCPNC